MAKTIYILNGSNMNMLGTREPEKYGSSTLADVEKLCHATAKRFGIEVVFRQSNHEGVIVDWIHEAYAKKADGIGINAAGFTTTSVSILDALLAVKLPVIEIHMTNIHARESFRHDSYMSKAAKAMVCGFGVDSYSLAIIGLAGIVGAEEKR
jgi:3-dehydroquinate dehydratase II